MPVLTLAYRPTSVPLHNIGASPSLLLSSLLSPHQALLSLLGRWRPLHYLAPPPFTWPALLATLSEPPGHEYSSTSQPRTAESMPSRPFAPSLHVLLSTTAAPPSQVERPTQLASTVAAIPPRPLLHVPPFLLPPSVASPQPPPRSLMFLSHNELSVTAYSFRRTTPGTLPTSLLPALSCTTLFTLPHSLRAPAPPRPASSTRQPILDACTDTIRRALDLCSPHSLPSERQLRGLLFTFGFTILTLIALLHSAPERNYPNEEVLTLEAHVSPG
ncbi:hypothetical protein K488DRAFT_91871 [Vararia minispora EC-137]|uniref:Uncharacterized protein n=1 Tax=Vararia minispora EC-137 TaxID=1314806 RepID=A0ACB8Q4V3_9AGAM|nr:hypothetical protein K488DRAFT_91871 [Vararia minispora EC-137]